MKLLYRFDTFLWFLTVFAIKKPHFMTKNWKCATIGRCESENESIILQRIFKLNYYDTNSNKRTIPFWLRDSSQRGLITTDHWLRQVWWRTSRNCLHWLGHHQWHLQELPFKEHCRQGRNRLQGKRLPCVYPKNGIRQQEDSRRNTNLLPHLWETTSIQ